jgi:hypothetical protein
MSEAIVDLKLSWWYGVRLYYKYACIYQIDMPKFDGIKGQELLDVEESHNEITLIFKDNRFLFVKVQDGRLVCDSVPE